MDKKDTRYSVVIQVDQIRDKCFGQMTSARNKKNKEERRGKKRKIKISIKMLNI